jgi:hypothetical protein
MSERGIDYVEMARTLDRRADAMGAAWAFEVALSAGSEDLDVFLDLCVVYQSIWDAGQPRGRGVPEELFGVSLDRSLEVLDVAEAKCGAHAEIEFWRGYFEDLYNPDGSFPERCRQWCASGETKVGAAYLYGVMRDFSYSAQAAALLREVKDGATSRKRFLRSLLADRDGHLRHGTGP